MHTMMPIHMNSKQGLELYAYLKGVLSLPDNCIEVTITLKQNDLISVCCTYYPSRSSDEPCIKTFDLFPAE
jgi:hypothetical protein